MSLIDEALVANRNYAKMPDPKLRERPTPKLAVVTCMDPRLSDLPAFLDYRMPISTLSERLDQR